MKKWMFLLVAMAFIVSGYNDSAFAQMAGPIGKEAGDVSHWVGKEVRNPQGERLGRVNDIVRDKHGNASLLIISHGGVMGIGGKKVAVPFDRFSFSDTSHELVLNATKTQLDNAPAIGNGDLTDPAFVQEMHRYFGERPQWSDEGARTRSYSDSHDQRKIK